MMSGPGVPIRVQSLMSDAATLALALRLKPFAANTEGMNKKEVAPVINRVEEAITSARLRIGGVDDRIMLSPQS
jgi:hypothetical protein